MGKNLIQKRAMIALGLAVLLGVLWMGCSSTLKQSREEAAKGGESGIGQYYYFGDVLVPKELKFKPNKSFIYETPRSKTGVMVFTKWWLDAGSLVDFFNYHMEKDNWKLVNSFRGKESVLNFSKPDKSCAIKISEKWSGTTEVEIRVGPLEGKKM
jgi:hypothetical protein